VTHLPSDFDRASIEARRNMLAEYIDEIAAINNRLCDLNVPAETVDGLVINIASDLWAHLFGIPDAKTTTLWQRGLS